MHSRDQAKAERQTRHLEHLSETALEFAGFPFEEDLYEHIARRLEALVGDSIVLVFSCVEGTNLLECRSLVGLGSLSQKIFGLIGQSLVGMRFEVLEELGPFLREGKLTRLAAGMYELAGGQIPRPACAAMTRILGITGIYSLGIARQGQLFAHVTLLARSEDLSRNTTALETFANQASVALQNRRSEEARRRSEEQLRHLNEVLRSIRNISQIITREDNREKLLETVCRCLIETRGYASALLVMLDGSGALQQAFQACSMEGFPDLAKALQDGAQMDCVELAKASNEVVFVEAAGCQRCPLAKNLREHSAMAVRVQRHGRVFGVLVVCTRKMEAGNPEEQELIKEISEDVALALHGLEQQDERRGFALAQQQLQDQLQKAQRMEAVGRLAAGIAHDFNNLLTVIQSYCGTVLSGVSTGDRALEDVREIQRAATRAADLPRQLLAFGRRQLAEPTVIDLNAVVSDLVTMLQRVIGEDIEVVTALGRPLGSVKADPGQVEQILLNLAVNARDAMPSGGRLTIETSNAVLDGAFANVRVGVRPGAYVQLAVRDTGVGMSDAVKERAFEPLFTTKGDKMGSGLGLATVHGIVKQNGGHIEVNSEVGEGTTVTIYLPRIDGAAPRVRRPSRGRMRIVGDETILLVEDDALVRRAIVRTLRRAGFNVLEAGSGGEALQVAQAHAHEIHLVLTDVVMRGLSGKELANQIAATRPDVPVVFMSGYAGDEVVHDGLLDEGTPFIEKPFTDSQLLAKLRAILDAEPEEP